MLWLPETEVTKANSIPKPFYQKPLVQSSIPCLPDNNMGSQKSFLHSYPARTSWIPGELSEWHGMLVFYEALQVFTVPKMGDIGWWVGVRITLLSLFPKMSQVVLILALSLSPANLFHTCWHWFMETLGGDHCLDSWPGLPSNCVV